MPILKPQTEVHQENLIDCFRPCADRQWWVLYTMARRE